MAIRALKVFGTFEKRAPGHHAVLAKVTAALNQTAFISGRLVNQRRSSVFRNCFAAISNYAAFV